MKLYADLPVRRTAQVAADLGLVLWIVLRVRLGQAVGDATMALARPGEELEGAGVGLAARLRDAGESIGGLPVVGEQAARPFEGAGGAADQLASAGRAQIEAVESLAFWLTLVITLIPILVALAIHLPIRIRFIRRATAGQRFMDAAEDLDLFALRALSRQPLHVLARVSDDPAGAWRAGDREAITRLADLELRSSGLRAAR